MVRGRPVEEHVQRRAEQAPPLRVVPPQRPRLKPLASTRSAPRCARSLPWARLGGAGHISRALERPVALKARRKAI